MSGNSKIHSFALDLSSQKDVRRFAKEIDSKFTKLHYLVNNAGMANDGFGLPMERTEDGFEKIISTNYLGSVVL
jgi:NAD(P)-dependent dehydrogenase (short-subunit alcohol dehydrogenase family)